MLFLVAGCAPTEPVSQEIRVGLILPFSGPLSSMAGEPVVEGSRLAVEQQVPAQGLEVGGRTYRVELVIEDSLGSPEVAVEAARRLINQERVVALVGPCLSHTAMAVAAVAEKQGIPMITPTATHREVTAGRHSVFRVAPIGEWQARALARFAVEDLEAQSAAVLYDITTAYNRDVAETFSAAFAQLDPEGGASVLAESYTAGETDFRAQLERIREGAPAVLLLPNYVDEVPLQVEQARALGIDATILGSDSWSAQSFAMQELFDQSYFTDGWHPDVSDATSREFITSYRDRFQREPTSATALAYDAVGVLLRALTLSPRLDGESVRQALASLSDFQGVTGPISFAAGSDPLKSVAILKIDQGQVSLRQWIRP